MDDIDQYIKSYRDSLKTFQASQKQIADIAQSYCSDLSSYILRQYNPVLAQKWLNTLDYLSQQLLGKSEQEISSTLEKIIQTESKQETSENIIIPIFSQPESEFLSLYDAGNILMKLDEESGKELSSKSAYYQKVRNRVLRDKIKARKIKGVSMVKRTTFDKALKKGIFS